MFLTKECGLGLCFNVEKNVKVARELSSFLIDGSVVVNYVNHEVRMYKYVEFEKDKNDFNGYRKSKK